MMRGARPFTNSLVSTTGGEAGQRFSCSSAPGGAWLSGDCARAQRQPTLLPPSPTSAADPAPTCSRDISRPAHPRGTGWATYWRERSKRGCRSPSTDAIETLVAPATAAVGPMGAMGRAGRDCSTMSAISKGARRRAIHAHACSRAEIAGPRTAGDGAGGRTTPWADG